MVSTFPKKVEDRSAELLPGKSSRVSQTIVPSTEIVDEVYSSSRREGVSPEWRCIKRVFGSVNDVRFLEICGEA